LPRRLQGEEETLIWDWPVTALSSSPFNVIRPPPVTVPKGFFPSWGGSLISKDFYPPEQVPRRKYRRPFRARRRPPCNEEIFEWHSIGRAIEAAKDRFTVVELGAGYGRWCVAAAVICRHLNLPCAAIAVEAEPGHFAMLKQHFEDNGFDWRQHRLIEAAVASQNGAVHFTVGAAMDWWGQAVLPSADYGYGTVEGVSVVSVPALSLASIIEDVELVDLIDMDIQGAEADVIEGSAHILNRVRRLHIGTHTHEVEDRLRRTLGALGWTAEWDYPCNSRAWTPYGRVKLQDGVQAWVNPRI
jgi:FkbM family methyltransferase